MAGVVTVSGSSLTSYPLVALEGWAAALETSYQTTALPGQTEVHRMPYPTVAPRVVRLSVLVTSSTVAARGAALDTLMAYFPRDTELTLSFDDDAAKEVKGYVTREATVSVAPDVSFALPDLIQTFEITCYDPCKYDASNTTVTCTNALVTAAVGTIECGGVFTVTGLATNPTLVYASGGATSTVAASLVFSCVLATGDTLAVDLDLLTALYTASTGLTANYLQYWSSGEWWKIDPADKTSGANPQVKVSSGAGSLVYKRKWRS